MKIVTVLIALVLVLGLSIHGTANESNEALTDEGSAYFDSVTGNRYVRNGLGSYLQYSRKGHLMRDNVPAGQPHMANSRDLIPLKMNTYILYEKYVDSTKQRMILPSTEPHPMADWKSTRVLVSLD